MRLWRLWGRAGAAVPRHPRPGVLRGFRILPDFRHAWWSPASTRTTSVPVVSIRDHQVKVYDLEA
jgi:hypothetical protein